MQDIVNKAVESAKALTHTALDKGKEQAQTLVQHAPEFGEAAKHQLANAQVHLSELISTGAESARAAIHSAAKAVSEATEPKPPAPPGG